MDELNDRKVRGKLQSVSKHWEWEQCKDEKMKVIAREQRHLTGRLVKLAQEQEMSELESEELSSLLREMDSLEQEVQSVGQLGNMIKRHDCIEMCRRKIEEILRRSRLRGTSDPFELGNARAALECTSAHKLLVAKQKEKKRLLQQYRPQQSQAGPCLVPKVPTVTTLRDSAESLIPDSQPGTPGSTSHADTRLPTFDDTFRKRMMANSSVFSPGHDRAPDQFKRQALMAASSPNYRGLASESRAGIGHSVYRGGPPLTPSEEWAMLVAIGRDTSGQFRPSALSLRRRSDLPSLSRSSVSRHLDDHSGNRRRLAMESLLNQINEYKAAQYSIHPKDLLACRYLRLTPSNVTQLERQSRELGKDPGLHCYLTEQQVLDHFDYLESMSVPRNHSSTHSNNRM